MSRLSEIKSAIAELREMFSAKTAAPTDLQTRLQTLESTVDGALTEASEAVTRATTQISALTTEKANLTGKLERAQSEVNTQGAMIGSVNAALDRAVSGLKLEIAEKASAEDKVMAIFNSVTTTLTRLQVDLDKLPVGIASDSNAGAGLVAKLESITHPVERVSFYRKHKAEIDAARRRQFNR